MTNINPETGCFQITIGGITLSAGLGPVHCCDARYEKPVDGVFKSANVEVALFAADGGAWMTKEIWKEVIGEDLDDDVVGWVTPEQFAQLISYLNERNQNESQSHVFYKLRQTRRV
jgi:hypothetical protein